MKLAIKMASGFFILFTSPYLFAQDHSHLIPHDHKNHSYGPIGVMGEHQHSKGDWMFSYAYKSMEMDSNRDGNKEISTSQVLADFMVSPTNMSMQMHMFGLMYGVSEKFMVMGMLPYSYIAMQHENRMGIKFKTKAEGIGDVKLSGSYAFLERGSQRVLLNFGVSFPTGSTNRRDDTPAGNNQKLPYPMQLGSGTYDFSPGLTYTDKMGHWFLGSQAKATIRMGKNDDNYRLGNEFAISTWGVRSINELLNGSLRIDAKSWGNIKGVDAELNPMMVPTSRTDLRSGKRIDLVFGIDFTATPSKSYGNRLGIEVGLPIYQNLSGPQLAADYQLTLAWQLVF